MQNSFLTKFGILALLTIVFGFPTLLAKTITTTPQGGAWSEGSTWIGGDVPTKDDDVVITSLVTANGQSYSAKTYVMNDLTVENNGKILREGEGSGGLSKLEINGDLVNNGEIVDLYDYFDIEIFGNLINNAVLKPRTITLSGSNVSITSTEYIESKNLRINVTNEFITANNDLKFKNCFITSENDKYIKMGDYNLYLKSDTITYDGYYGQMNSKSRLTVPLVYSNSGNLYIDKSIYSGEITGNVTIESNDYAFLTNVTVNGDLYIAENTKISGRGNLELV